MHYVKLLQQNSEGYTACFTDRLSDSCHLTGLCLLSILFNDIYEK